MWRNGSTTQHSLTTAADGGEWAAAHFLAHLTPHPRKWDPSIQ